MGGRCRRVLGSRKYRDYSLEMLDLAVDLVSRKQMSSLEAEKRFHIPRRTIENKVKNKHSKKPGGQVRLSQSEEAQIVNVVIAAAEFGSPLTHLDLRLVVFDYLKKNDKEDLFDKKPPGKWWIKHFLIRHKESLTVRAVQNIKKVRAAKISEEFEIYFENLKNTIQNIPKCNILNYDESNLSDNPGSIKCIFKRKVKYPERVMNHSKGNISIMFAAAADGTLLPVYTVYKAEHLWESWCQNGPNDARFNRTKSGWFDATVFEDWFKTVVIPWANKLEGPKVVIGDNLSSHLNIDIIRQCEKNNIRFAFLPPNSTHLSQPLDVAFFGPLKKKWRQILTDYKIKNPAETQLNKAHFPILLKSLLEAIEIVKKENICSGFKATGIVPLNPRKILKKLPDYEEETKYTIDSTLLDYLKANRAANPLKRTHNKKIKLAPGASISTQELVNLTSDKESNEKTDKKKPKPKALTAPKRETTKKVTILSDVKFTPENTAYTDLTKSNIFKFDQIHINYDIFSSRNKENMHDIETEYEQKNLELEDYDDPVPSTSAANLTTSKKRPLTEKTPSRISLAKRNRLREEETDDSNEDDYSLRDSSDEGRFISESEESLNPEEETKENMKKTKYSETIITQVNTFILVKFYGKKVSMWYVGKIIEMSGSVGMIVKFMRRKKENIFYWPKVDDISLVLETDVELALENPRKGRRGTLIFDADFSKFNVQ